jgi:hypothetical protein
MRIVLVLVAMTTLARAANPPECANERKRVSSLKAVLASVGETTAEYRAMMLKRIQEAETAVANCERAATEAKRAAEAREAKLKRDEEEAAQKTAAERFEMDELKSQAKFIQVA